jgi:hypothetical protein
VKRLFPITLKKLLAMETESGREQILPNENGDSADHEAINIGIEDTSQPVDSFAPDFPDPIPPPGNGEVLEIKLESEEPPPIENVFSPDFPDSFTSDSTQTGVTADKEQGAEPSGSFDFSFGDFPENPSQGGEFQFNFEDFPGDAAADAFTFDADEAPAQSEEEQLYTKLLSLIKNPILEDSGRPLIELFRHNDETDSAASALSLLLGPQTT